jgi:predicted metal-dependent phosphoesterase TrpH
MSKRADLHIHSLYSDGVLSPIEIVTRAKRAGLDIISITDHDSVGGLEAAIEAGRDIGIEVISGIELSANQNGFEVHILGYFIDYKNKELASSLAGFRNERLKRAQRIVGKLNDLKIPITIESVLGHVTGDSIGRPHIANTLVEGGHADSYHQAFDKFIGDGRPAYEQKWNFSPEETVRLISQAGGLSFLAHPGKSMSEEMIIQLIKAGLDGIEVVHPCHTPDLVYYYKGIVDEYCLLESGGSDFHGGELGDEGTFGQYSIPISAVDLMRKRLF